MAETQTAYAKSALTDPQNILFAIQTLLSLLALPQILAIIPVEYMKYVLALTGALGVIGIAVRTRWGNNPVALVGPRQIVPVEVKKLEATKQGTEEAANLPTQLPSGEVPK